MKAFELKASGLRVQVISWGCHITQLHAPDSKHKWKDLVIGFDIPGDFAGYHDGRSMYYGSVIGRYGNRIANGRFKLNGEEYKLATNNGPHHMHGGEKGWDSKNWDVVESGCAADGREPFVKFSYASADNEEGYPAALKVTVTYKIIGGDTLSMKYTVTNEDAKKSTVVNITNHSYFNLSGDLSKDITDHVVLINASAITAVADNKCIPTGELRPVGGTPFDFNAPKRIGDDIDKKEYDQIEYGTGYDHTFVLDGAEGMKYCATVFEPTTGRKMEICTTEPGVQFYTGNWMSAEQGKGKSGVPLARRTGFCLETQHFPDSPNQPSFPTTELAAGACYSSETTHRFTLGTPLKKPKWGSVEKIHPEMKGINLKLKCVSCKKNEGTETWDAVVGDESGVVTLHLQNEKLASLCKEGAALRLQNAKVVMMKGFVRVVVDKWAVLKVADDVSFEPNTKKDVSATEYELS